MVELQEVFAILVNFYYFKAPALLDDGSFVDEASREKLVIMFMSYYVHLLLSSESARSG